MPSWGWQAIGAVAGLLVGGTGFVCLNIWCWRLLTRDSQFVAGSWEGLAGLHGILLGAGTGWAIALALLGQAEACRCCCTAFGVLGVLILVAETGAALWFDCQSAKSEWGRDLPRRSLWCLLLWTLALKGLTVLWTATLFWLGSRHI